MDNRLKVACTAWIISAAMVGPCHANAAGVDGDMAVAPGGRTVYHIIETDAADPPSQSIIECQISCSKKRVLLTTTPGNSPESSLTGFHNLALSPDASKLYFETEAWATSSALHVIDLKSGAQRFVTAGSLACVVGSGEYQGDLIVSEHKYFVQGGSYNPLSLFSADGKRIGIVALDDSEAPRFCGSL